MKNINLTAEEIVIIDRLKQMKMSGMAEAYEEQIKNPNSDLSGFYERFSNIVNYEWELRFNKKFNRFLKKATLRYPQAAFDDTIYDPARMLDTETKTTSHKYAKREEKILLNRMDKYSHNHLLFLQDFLVPFDDNISERDLRKAKNRQKMAGGFRKESGNEMYCSIMTVVETLKKRNMGIIENLKKLFMGTPAIF